MNNTNINKARSVASTLSASVKLCKNYFGDDLALFAESIASDKYFGRSKTDKEILLQNENITFSHKYIYMDSLSSSFSDTRKESSSEMSYWGYELDISNEGLETRLENIFDDKAVFNSKLKSIFKTKLTESECYSRLASILSEKIITSMNQQYAEKLNEYSTELQTVQKVVNELETDLNNANFNQLSSALSKGENDVIPTYVKLVTEMKSKLNSDVAGRVLHLDFEIDSLKETIKRVSLPTNLFVERINDYNSPFRMLSLSMMSQAFVESKYKIDLSFCDDNDCRLIKASKCKVDMGGRTGVVSESGDNAPQEADDFVKNCTVSLGSVMTDSKKQFLFIELMNSFRSQLESKSVFYNKNRARVDALAQAISDLRNYIPVLNDDQKNILRDKKENVEDSFDIKNLSGRSVGGGSIGGTSFGRLGGSVVIFDNGKAKRAKNLFGDFYYAYIGKEKKFVVVEKNSLKGLVIPSDLLYTFNIQLQKYEKEKNNYSKVKKVVGGADMAGSVVGTGLVGLGRILINGSHAAYNKFASIVEENASTSLPRVKSKQTIAEAIKNTWATLSNKTKTRTSKRQLKELQKQIKNQTLIHQLKSVAERKVIENLLGTQDYITHVMLEKDQVYGDNLKKHIRELEAKIPTLNVYTSIVSTLPPQ